MVEIELTSGEKVWKTFLRKHWKMLVMFIVVAAVLSIGAILVLLWLVGNAQATSLVPAMLGLWTMGYIVTFLLHLIFWEVLFVGIPVIVVIAAIVVLWWKRLPAEERVEYRRGHLFGKRSRRADGSGALSFFVFLGLLIKVYVDGNWNVPFATWTFDYLVYSVLWVFIWIVIIVGIPLLLGGTWWLRREMKKKP
jgi:hypothetical protein